MMPPVILVLFVMLSHEMIIEGVLCPTNHHRCSCQTAGEGRRKTQSLVCTGVWSLPVLNDTVPAATADRKLLVEDSNDLGLVALSAFSGLRRHKVELRKNLRLARIENHAFKDAKIDHLKISGFHTHTINLIESEAFNKLTSLSRNVRDCDWDGRKITMKCSTSVHLSNIASFTITDRTFVTHKNLQDLYLNVEKLEIRHGSFEELKDLQQLRIMGSFSFTPSKSTFEGLSSLRVLHMIGIGLARIPPDLFAHVPRLEVLDLSRNHIRQVSVQSFSGLTHLTHLSLERNKLEDATEVQLTNGDFPKLKVLRMNDNRLTTLPLWLQAQRQIEEIYFRGNTILCDCRLFWLHDWKPIRETGWDSMFSDLVATCSSENWLTCSKVCPFDCRLEDCVMGLKTKKCKSKTMLRSSEPDDHVSGTGSQQTGPPTKRSSSVVPMSLLAVFLHIFMLLL